MLRWRSHFGLLSGFIFVMRWVAGWADGDVVGEAMAPLPVDFVQSIHSIRVKCEPQWQSIQNKWVTDKVFIRLGLSWKKERVPGDFAAQTLSFLCFYCIMRVKLCAFRQRDGFDYQACELVTFV